MPIRLKTLKWLGIRKKTFKTTKIIQFYSCFLELLEKHIRFYMDFRGYIMVILVSFLRNQCLAQLVIVVI